MPSAWSIWHDNETNQRCDNLSIDDLYNNLRVFEQEIQGAPKPSSSAQNVAFVSQSKSSTNKVKSGFSGAYSSCTPSTSSTNVPEKEVLAGFADEVIYSLFAKQTEDLDLLHEDLEQIDDVDIEEMDINWQIAMIAIRMKKFYKKTTGEVRVDGENPCVNVQHRWTYEGKKKRDSLYQQQELGTREETDGFGDNGLWDLSIWGEPTEAEEYKSCPYGYSLKQYLSHLIKDCDYYEKKMAREAEVKRVVNTGPKINSAKVNYRLVLKLILLAQLKRISPQKTTDGQINQRRWEFGESALSIPQQVYKLENSRPNSIITEYPLKNMVDRGIFDSGCSGHMTGNKDQLEGFDKNSMRSVTFGGSKGYISGKGKQHRASCKAKLERLITKPLHTLHMDLFGPTSVKSINHASYCLVITDDCTRFCWVFFLASKDETSGILQTFIRQIENQLSHRVKIIRSDNGTEFKNRDMLEFCGNKGIKQEYSNARTPQQNGVAERMNRTLIEAARTMLADSTSYQPPIGLKQLVLLS
ncbi:putative ribonuclease H-like domain-containing protein [Tanacetum coccineum]